MLEALVDALLVTLCVVKQGEEGGKRVRDRRRTEVVLKDLEHFKALAIKRGPHILVQETSGAILDSRPKLTLPILAGESVPCVRQKELIRTGRRKTRGAKPEQEDVACLKVVGSRFDGGKSEAVRWDWDGHKWTAGRRNLDWRQYVHGPRPPMNQNPRSRDGEIVHRGKVT
jgi:hypothetical protein